MTKFIAQSASKKSKARLWKLALGFSAVLLYSMFFVFVAFGQEKSEDTPIVASPSNLWSAMLQGMGAASPDSFTDKDVFGAPVAGQNLYMLVYKKISVEPEKQAIRETAQAFGLNLREAYEVRQGSATPFLDQDKSNKFTQAQSLERVALFQKQFQERLQQLQFESRLVNENAPSEIFYNGDITDSGFDLIYDLQIIEQILFNEQSGMRVGGEFTGGIDPKKESEYDKPAPKDLSPATGFNSKQGGLSAGSGDGSGDGSGAGDGDDSSSSGDSSDSSGDADGSNDGPTNYAFNKSLPKSSSGDLVDPSFCATDYGLANALAEAPGGDFDSNLADFSDSESSDADNSASADSDANSSSSGQFGSTSSALTVAYPKPDSEKTIQELETEFASFEEYYDNLQPAQAKIQAKESDGPLCYGPICFEVNFRYKEAGLYSPGETCIACEVGKINDNLLETIKNNLSPSKAPGNIFESAKCKKGLINSISMNVITIFNPMQGPPSGDLLTSKDVTERWNDFQKRYKPDFWTNHYNKRPESPVSPEKQKELEEKSNNTDITEKALKDAKANTPDNITQFDLEREVNKRVAKSVADTEKRIDEFEVQTSVGEYGEFYKLLEYEINRMDLYFKAYKSTFDALNTKTCPQIKNKQDVK